MMCAYKCKLHGIFIKRLVECTDISGHINAPVLCKDAAKRMVSQGGVEWVMAENYDSLLKTPLYFYRHLPVLLLEAPVEKDFHRRLR